ncbi:DUF1674 domain-containing protein [Marinicella sp. S1101]|uniref:DUF1674 domain-containing protein n=1 Tax=Marinicella marina TaxID=2996016 RepID=UPI002260D42F|nr:DUF1674 domain-containing protein [Marinicella marina]MCX7554458.1 DUF1674 domain-containing protein [Marinicella marina]MDJ1140609.1 DUF1674 domain-containing protein [Marinicella marina]
MNQIKEDNKKPQKNKDDAKTAEKKKEYGGRKDGLDPTRYGDWEKNGRCIDF